MVTELYETATVTSKVAHTVCLSIYVSLLKTFSSAFCNFQQADPVHVLLSVYQSSPLSLE